MIAKVFRRHQRLPLREIGRRRHGEETKAVANAYCAHVLRRRLGETHARIEPVLDDIYQPSLGGEIERHLRIAGEKKRDHCPQQQPHG